MLIVAGKFTFDPSKTDIAKAACAKIMAATHQEPENIEYVFSFDAADPATIRVFEVWENDDDLNALLAGVGTTGGDGDGDGVATGKEKGATAAPRRRRLADGRRCGR